MVVAVALDIVALALLGWTTWTALGSRERPNAGPFIALLATLTLWAALALGSAAPVLSSVSALSGVWELAQFAPTLLLPGIWTIYALGYTGRGTGLTWRRLLMLAGIALPVLVAGAVIAAGPDRSVVEGVVASALGTELLYLTGLFVYATYLLVGLGRNHARVSKRQVAVLTLGVAAPYLAGVVWDWQPPVDGVTAGLLVSGTLLAVALRRYPVMTGFPKADYVARTRVFETLREAVVVLDWDDHVLDVNAAATRLFDGESAAMVGEPVGDVVAGLGRTDLPVGTTGTVTLRTTRGRRQFQFTVSAVDDAGSDDGATPVARTVLLRDVTDQRTREQRLTVLNRVLRHNVRNELDVVLAHAERIEDEDIRAGVRDTATELLELGRKARDAEEIMDASTEPPAPVDLAEVAADVADDHRDRDGELSVSSPAELVISSHRTVVRRLLVELVDNALTHTDRDEPSVEIRVREGGDAAAVLTVADDGPGIPERERQVLAEGGETQLEHGRGLGLWLVNWAVTQLGGDLEFEHDDGSVVRVRLYGAAYGDPSADS
jgi:signal transduction histidine kinase